ncbi:GDP-mannose pyrophosphorylase [Prochlorococcus marinus subsp. pastoris str. CCMP1986]|uniref:mannose-1-phosphate guanylyltransferase n=1 Tax=Prochlorococcus marinus subsp. pastoris (strain CCMP1986 / NIES-2087 / MED4) TaxID=59919 RepID=Q7V0R0_PROMP|nr:mannose-1-phosphate guanylyltransferase/mannose-6-phosphate isomerase [Prochlorococcus marinus]KGF87244.1 Mannose-1-phosphate guanylyltransferase (GDP) [Prochlorococcus marinus str. EQPAC1]CAE19655.1 GDP-mannose pyrophosphorylase [Prochlorococcus marinus subsp. pastoris str. CCMP1986]
MINNLKSDLKLQPVILSGGKGSRLWPLSRECYPKQYLELYEGNKFSLLQNTFLRLNLLDNLEPPIIICNESQRFLVAEQMLKINVVPKSIIIEPVGKNTGPAVALAAIAANKKGQDPALLILSSDHVINDSKEFTATIIEGLIHAKQGKIVSFGVVPTYPETGYGYIESLEELTNFKKSSSIKRFIEKPEEDRAKQFIQSNLFTWNSGIFLFKASTIIQEFNRFAPEIIHICKKSIVSAVSDLDFLRLNNEIFQKCPNVPIDIAIMEKTDKGTVVRLNAGWSDIGNWESVWDNSTKDNERNSTKGNVLLMESHGCYLRSEKRLLVGLGLKDLIVIETDDAVLVINKSSAQKVKHIVEDLEKKNISEGKVNKKIYRPWGSYTSISNGITWQVKKLEVNPGASLSLQMHFHRTEHWIIVDGTAKVEINNHETILNQNESIYVPIQAKHRLSNPGNENLIIIEVQNGKYLGEDDIVRFEDIYGRKKDL